MKAKDIASNASEDFIEEGASELVYGISRCMFDKNVDKKECDSTVGSAFDTALEGSLQTLKFSITNAVIYRVTTYAMSKMVIGGGFILGYIKAGRIINTMRRKIKSAASGIPFYGRAIGELITVASKFSIGNQNERLKVAGMANDNLNNVTSMITDERRNAIMQTTHQREQVLKTLGLTNSFKNLDDGKKLSLYNTKMKTGTWTIGDKALFKAVVPRKYQKKGFSFSPKFVKKLNEFSEYAKNTENKIVNLAQTHLDNATANHLSKLK
jgi:hypothetical protein